MSVLTQVTCPFGCPWRYSDEDQAEAEEALVAHVQAHEDAKAAAGAATSEETPVPETTPCKIPGCGEPSIGAKTSFYAGLCAIHTTKEKAARAALKPAKRWDTKPKKTAAKPAATPIPVDTPNGHSTLSLVGLAQAVEDAREAHRVAVDALRAALEGD